MDYIEYTVKVYANGTKYWCLQGNLHREDGPAVEWADGTKAWYLQGKLHREDGTAIEHTNGNKFWYLHGKPLTEAEFQKQTAKDPCAGKVVEIDGKKYKLMEV